MMIALPLPGVGPDDELDVAPDEVCVNTYDCPPAATSELAVPVPPSAMPVAGPCGPLMALPEPSKKNAVVNAPPVTGSIAMVHPDDVALKQLVADVAGGMVVLTTNAP